MGKIVYKLPEFEGPLDLLLYLISKHKLDIYNIQISLLLEQYMEHIENMEKLDMDLSSEFLEMAARLVYIKTVSLLPKNEEVNELKRELEGQLIEYKECKEMSQILKNMIKFNTFVREPVNLKFDNEYSRNHSIEELLSSYVRVIDRNGRNLPPKKERFAEIVSRHIISVASKVIHILRKLWNNKEIEYESIYDCVKEKSELVATFLAVLELIKCKRIKIEENDGLVKIKLINNRVKKCEY